MLSTKIDYCYSAWCSRVDRCAVDRNRLYQLWLTHLTRTNRQRKLDYIIIKLIIVNV
jgi:hypothetical protein